MNRIAMAIITGVLSICPIVLSAQVAGTTSVGLTVIKEEIVRGWSAKEDILGESVYNDKKEKIGEINDLIITPTNAISYAVVGVGGFIGIGERHVIIPVEQFKKQENAIVLTGATKEVLKGLPEFHYKKK